MLCFGSLILSSFYLKAFVRKDALPLGTFSKYTWHITNILQVKQILDTPEVRVYFYSSGRTERGREGSKCGNHVYNSSLSSGQQIPFFHTKIIQKGSWLYGSSSDCNRYSL